MLSIILLAPLTAYANNLTEGDYSYTTDGITSTITKYNGTDNNIVIPATLGGNRISTIGSNAFSNSGMASVSRGCLKIA